MSSVLDFKRPLILEHEPNFSRLTIFRFGTMGQLAKFLLLIIALCPTGADAVISKVDPTNSNPILVKMPKIYKGRQASHGGFQGHPYLVSIQYLRHGESEEGVGYYEYEPFCGGVILDHRTIITAGHCFDTIPNCLETETWRCYRIVAGRHDITNDSQAHEQIRQVPARAITIHENYTRSNLTNDIAMIHLDEPLLFNTFVQCIQLVTPNKTYSRTGIIAGWGMMSPRPYSSKLQEANVTIYSDDDCECQWESAYQKEGMICAGNDVVSSKESDESVADACLGDSGGPLVVTDLADPTRKYLAGIISWGYTPCGSKGYPGLYTKVGAYVDWIRRKIRCQRWRTTHHHRRLHRHHHSDSQISQE